MPKQPKPKKPGRPKMAKGEAKGSIVPVRFSPEERKRVEAAARANNQTVSAWVRSTLNSALEA
jgi:predicted HicB family RNase H-like nuclease